MPKGEAMIDPFLTLLDWLTPMLKRDWSAMFAHGTTEHAILEEFRQGWGTLETERMLKHLSEKYGPMAAATVEMRVSKYIEEDWAELGTKEARPGTEIRDFIRNLWGSLPSQGFQFTQTESKQRIEMNVTKCPIHELAERTKLHAWLYHLSCATDFYSTEAFSPKIRFSRTKTLMEGHECCNHTYTYREG
jgi:predicted ArsR family transcriptional regulator